MVTKKEREQKIRGVGQQSLMSFPLERERDKQGGGRGRDRLGQTDRSDTKRTLADDDDDDISMMMKQ